MTKSTKARRDFRQSFIYEPRAALASPRAFVLKMRALVCLLLLLTLASCRGDLRRPAPEIKNVRFINTSAPVTLAQLRGHVVLLDFWAYSCVNCLHVVSQIKQLERKYGDDLVVIGLHSPKYENEKADDNVKAAVERLEIDHAVGNDAQLSAWQDYGIQAWPTFVLIDTNGKICNQYIGDGKFKTLDTAIAAAIKQAKENGSLDAAATGPKVVAQAPSQARPTALRFPSAVACDPHRQRLFISDTGNHRIVVAGEDGKVAATVGDGTENDADGDFSKASFCEPGYLCVNGAVVYLSDAGNDCIRKIDLNKRLVSTQARRLDSPCGIAVLGKQIYIAMSGSHELWRMDLESHQRAAIAGNGFEDLKDGIGRAAQFAQPTGLASDGTHLYIADTESSSVRQFDPATNAVTTVIGKTMNEAGDKDGPGSEALLQHPLGLCVDGGFLYIADTYNHKIKRYSIAEKTVTTVVGSGKPGYKDGEWPSFAEPSEIAIMNGTAYIADTNNNAIRKLDLASGKVSTLVLK